MSGFRNVFLIAAIAALPLVMGCGPKYHGTRGGEVGENWGQSLDSIKYSQVLHPEAGGTEPVEGMDGRKAQQVDKEYETMSGGGSGSSGSGTTTSN
ncbi:MAG: hypothetical protein ACOC7W_03350 [Desulfosalsimonas sp.]